MQRRSRRSEAGVSLVALMAAVTITLLMMSAAVPTWRYIMKNDREEELIFRGGQIADAVCRFQKKNGNAFPPSLDVLVKGRFLRKAYKDPMTADGRWRFIRPGENVVGVPIPTPIGVPTPSPSPSDSPSPSPSPSPPPGGLGGSTGTTGGSFQGVASTSKDKSIRKFNNRTSYSEWAFIAGQPRVVGKTPLPLGCGGSGPGTPPGVNPRNPPPPPGIPANPPPKT